METDGTVVVRRKYERGRVTSKAQVWLFGGVERNTNGEQCFLAVIDGQRSAQNLTNDTEIHSSRVHHLFRSLALL